MPVAVAGVRRRMDWVDALSARAATIPRSSVPRMMVALYAQKSTIGTKQMMGANPWSDLIRRNCDSTWPMPDIVGCELG